MKAVYIEEHGGIEALTYGDLPEPEVGPNDVKVRVRATSINRLDLFTRAGVRGTRVRLAGPHILGGDTAGDVVEAGSEVTGVAAGDRVVVNPRLTCGVCPHCATGADDLCAAPGRIGSTAQGSYAEYVSVPAVNVVPLPDAVSYEQAASLPTVFLPSWSLLVRKAELKPWETALVLSASSGVGTAAIQVARNVVGATVIATTSSREKARMATELGADAAIDYTAEDVTARVKELTGGRGADVVLDHVGSDAWPAAMAALAPGRPVRDLRRYLRLPRRAADGNAVPEAADGVRGVHGPPRRAETHRADGRARRGPRRHTQDLPVERDGDSPRGYGGPVVLRKTGADRPYRGCSSLLSLDGRGLR